MCTNNGINVRKSHKIKLVEIDNELRVYHDSDLVNVVQNGFDYANWPVFVSTNDGTDIKLEYMEWGFLPDYLYSQEDVDKFRKGYKDDKGHHPPLTTLNAIGEEMLEKPMFKKAAKNNRCLVLSSHFFEWQHRAKVGKKGQTLKATDKHPYKIFLPGEDLFFMAGIYQSWTDKKTGETKNTFAIVTTAANALMEKIHNTKKRMPVILDEENARRWILPDLDEEEVKKIGKFQLPSHLMEAKPIHKDFRTNENPLAEIEEQFF